MPSITYPRPPKTGRLLKDDTIARCTAFVNSAPVTNGPNCLSCQRCLPCRTRGAPAALVTTPNQQWSAAPPHNRTAEAGSRSLEWPQQQRQPQLQPSLPPSSSRWSSDCASSICANLSSPDETSSSQMPPAQATTESGQSATERRSLQSILQHAPPMQPVLQSSHQARPISQQRVEAEFVMQNVERIAARIMRHQKTYATPGSPPMPHALWFTNMGDASQRVPQMAKRGNVRDIERYPPPETPDNHDESESQEAQGLEIRDYVSSQPSPQLVPAPHRKFLTELASQCSNESRPGALTAEDDYEDSAASKSEQANEGHRQTSSQQDLKDGTSLEDEMDYTQSVDDPDNAPSLGSMTHFDGSCRPCHYFRTRAGCNNGAQCSFCHYSHSKRSRPRLGKEDRVNCRLLTYALFKSFEASKEEQEEAAKKLAEATSSNHRMLSYSSALMRSLCGGSVLRDIQVSEIDDDA